MEVRCYVAAYKIIVCSKKIPAVLTGSWEPLSGRSQATKPRHVHKSPCKRGSANCRPTRSTQFAHVNMPLTTYCPMYWRLPQLQWRLL